MGNSITYRLIDNTKAASWSIKDGMKNRNGKLESIHYRPGATSIFDSDNKENPVQPAWVSFKYNENALDPACELVVDKSDTLLIEFVESLWYFKKVYDRYDPERVNELNAEKFDQIEEALKLVSESDETKIKAMALVILGFGYFTASPAKCKADLKSKAIQDSQTVIAEFNKEDYQSRYIASLAYCQGVIKSSETNTAVIWSDGNGQILSVAPGESPIEKLAKFIQDGSKESQTLLQEIGNRMDSLEAKKAPVIDNEAVAQILKENEEMRKKLAQLEAQKATNSTVESKQEATSQTEVDPEAEMLKAARAEYVELFKKNVPPNMQKNLEWITSKIEEAKSNTK
jgi:hypothetical protein